VRVGRHSVGPHVGACCPIRKRERMREKRIPLLFRVLPNSRRKATRSIGNVTKCAASSARLARTDFFYPSDLSRKAVQGILRLATAPPSRFGVHTHCGNKCKVARKNRSARKTIEFQYGTGSSSVRVQFGQTKAIPPPEASQSCHDAQTDSDSRRPRRPADNCPDREEPAR